LSLQAFAVQTILPLSFSISGYVFQYTKPHYDDRSGLAKIVQRVRFITILATRRPPVEASAKSNPVSVTEVPTPSQRREVKWRERFRKGPTGAKRGTTNLRGLQIFGVIGAVHEIENSQKRVLVQSDLQMS
jgi:hypothetical protein